MKKINLIITETPYMEWINNVKNKNKIQFNEILVWYKTSDDKINIKNIDIEIIDINEEFKKSKCNELLNIRFEEFMNLSIYSKQSNGVIMLSSDMFQYFKTKNKDCFDALTKSYKFGDFMVKQEPSVRDMEQMLDMDLDIKFAKEFREKVVLFWEKIIIEINQKTFEISALNFETFNLSGIYKTSRLISSSNNILKNNHLSISDLFAPISYWTSLIYEIFHKGNGNNFNSFYANYINDFVNSEIKDELINLLDTLANYVFNNYESFYYLNRSKFGLIHPEDSKTSWILEEERNPIIQSFIFDEETKKLAIEYCENLTQIVKTLVSIALVIHYKKAHIRDSIDLNLEYWINNLFN